MARTFTQLKKSMTTQQLNHFCKVIAESYANSNQCLSRTYYCEQYNITVSCYEKVKEYAIVNNLVSDKTVSLMRDKAVANQQFHMQKAGASSWKKYDAMMAKREVNKSDLTARRFACQFALNPYVPKSALAKMNSVSVKDFDLMLVKAIEENLVDDEIVDAIEERSINNTKSEDTSKVKRFFAELRKKREVNKEKNCL